MVESENGTEIAALHDATHGETKKTGHQGETGTFSKIGAAVVGDVGAVVTAKHSVQGPIGENERRVHPLHPKRRSQRQT